MLKVRIISPNGSRRHTADIKSRSWASFGRGKASAPYEFGVKASLVTTNARALGGQQQDLAGPHW
jgi:hypothetical protein